MQSYLIISRDKLLSEDKANKICRNFNIDNFDVNVLDKTDEASIGIEDIRIFQQKISLKPFKSKFKSGIIKNAEKLTTEAQNALLKTLEEPPNNTILILLSSNKELFLPTVLSRCKIIELKENAIELSEKDLAQCLTTLSSLTTLKIGDKLKIAQDRGKTREEAINFLEKMVVATRQQLLNKLIDDPESQIYNLKEILVSLTIAYKTIKTTNVNPRLTLENLLLKPVTIFHASTRSCVNPRGRKQQ